MWSRDFKLNATSTLAIAAFTAPAAAVTLPMKSGFYALAPTTCAAALKSYDNGMVIRGNNFHYGDGSNTVSGVKKTGPNSYLLTFTFMDEADKPHHFTAPVKLLPKGYWIKNSAATGNWLFCSPTAPKGWNE